MRDMDGETSKVILGILCFAGAATMSAPGFLVDSIRPSEVGYVAPEPVLRSYALTLAEAEMLQREARRAPTAEQAASAAKDPAPEAAEDDDVGHSAAPIVLADDADALTVFKNHLARRYAAATDNNRRINQRRAQLRTRAGLCTLASVLATLALVGVTV